MTKGRQGRPRSEAAVFVDVAGKVRVPNALRRPGADLAATPVPVLRGRAEGCRGAARGGRENIAGGVHRGAPASGAEGGRLREGEEGGGVVAGAGARDGEAMRILCGEERGAAKLRANDTSLVAGVLLPRS